MRQDCIHFYDKIDWDRTAFIFVTRWHETGLHSFLWQDCMKQDCGHFYDKMHGTGLHSFLWQDCMRPVLIHFYDKIVWNRTAFIFVTRLYETGTHPFYIGMYIHIFSHIYVHIYTSQKECLCIFWEFRPLTLKVTTLENITETTRFTRKCLCCNSCIQRLPLRLTRVFDYPPQNWHTVDGSEIR